MLLSLLLTGAGQIYCGKAGRGIAFFCAGLFAWVTLFFLIGFILLPAVWIWAAVDAASLAKRQNAMLMASVTGQPYAGTDRAPRQTSSISMTSLRRDGASGIGSCPAWGGGTPLDHNRAGATCLRTTG